MLQPSEQCVKRKPRRRSKARGGIQSRFRWILKPGNDLFLVLNRGWLRTFEGPYKPVFDKGTAKLQYTFRF